MLAIQHRSGCNVSETRSVERLYQGLIMVIRRYNNTRNGLKTLGLSVLIGLIALTSCRHGSQSSDGFLNLLTPDDVISRCGKPSEDQLGFGDPPSRVLIYNQGDDSSVVVTFFSSVNLTQYHASIEHRWVFQALSEAQGELTGTCGFDQNCHEFVQKFECLTTPVILGSNGHPSSPTLRLYDAHGNGLTASIDGVAQPTTPGATISSILWDFGDGSPFTYAWFPVNHASPQAGTFNVTALATDSDGLAQLARTTITVSGSTPASLLPTLKLFDPEVNGLSASFNGVTQPTVPGVTIASITWDFGDGVEGMKAWFPVNHNYSRPGTYRVAVVATDSSGNEQSANVTVTVKDWLQK
jgi:hypothetical protein